MLLRALLGLGKGRRVEPAMERAAQHHEGAGRRPEEQQGQGIAHPLEPVHDRVRDPFAGHQHMTRSSELGDEIDQVAEPFRPGQLLGSHESKHQHHAADCPDRDQRQEVAGPPRREHVDQHQRNRGSDDCGQDEERDQGANHGQWKQPAAVVHDAVRRQDRYQQQGHHPRRMDQRFENLREIEPAPVHRGRHQHVEVFGQEEGRERCHQVGEQQDRSERQQQHAEDLAGQQAADFRRGAEILEHPVKDQKGAEPEGAPNDSEQNHPPGGLVAALGHPGRHAPPFREHDLGDAGASGRGLSHRRRHSARVPPTRRSA